MSRLRDVTGRRTVSGGLFAGLIDDAAVFPPGSATLPDAVDIHRRLRQSPACTSVGPLLLPPASVPTLLELLADPAEPLTISLVGRPGDVVGLTAGRDLALRRDGLTVAGLEIAAGDRPIDDLVNELIDGSADQAITVALEIGRNTPEQLIDVARLREKHPGLRLRGKYRTGGVTPGAVPSADELAAVIVTAVQLGLPIKLTAGLHHAVRGHSAAAGSVQHGVLNVLLAVHRAFSDPESVAQQLERTDPAGIAAQIRSWTEVEIGEVRAIFTAFGCCGVLEPLTEAAALGVIAPVAHDLTAPHHLTVPHDLNLPECR